MFTLACLYKIFRGNKSTPLPLHPYVPSVLFMRHRQTVQKQIRCRRQSLISSILIITYCQKYRSLSYQLLKGDILLSRELSLSHLIKSQILNFVFCNNFRVEKNHKLFKNIFNDFLHVAEGKGEINIV